MLDVIFFFFFSSLPSLPRGGLLVTSAVSRQIRGSRRWAGGGRRLRETRRGTKQMIKDQLIKHFLCNLK